MLPFKALHAPVCASCRLRGAIAAKQAARSRRTVSSLRSSSRPQPLSTSLSRSRRLATSTTVFQRSDGARSRKEREQRDLGGDKDGFADLEAEREGIQYAQQLLKNGMGDISPEKAALTARETYGQRLPKGVLDGEAERVFVRFYGEPLRPEEEGEEERDGEGEVGLLREGRDGKLEEVEFEAEVEVDAEGMQEMEGDDVRLREDMEAALSQQGEDSALKEVEEEQEASESTPERAHPLTAINRFGTSPSSLPLPTDSLVEPISHLLAGTNNKHLAESAHKALGGIGLPYSPSTPNLAKTMQAKPIQIDAFQHHVSEIEGDVFLAAILPGVYASVISVLTETRKRLGTAWAEGLVKKAEKGELRILDAGGAGAGVLAVRELLRAEWERMHEERSTLDSSMALAEAGGQLGGPGVSPPLGNATVVTGSDSLRRRAAKLLENTTFIPRLPDYVNTLQQKEKGKFDLVIAPHTLWSTHLRFDKERKAHVQNFWGLTSAEGGVMCLVEKGVARGFEVVAGAREMLLRTRMLSKGVEGREVDEVDARGAEIEWEGESIEEEASAVANASEAGVAKTAAEKATKEVWEKEPGTIIAPCTTHSSCPMYRPKGFLKGRRDVCAFEQRYVRPAWLQRILGARDKNYEDLKFSYLAVMRGRDLLEERSLAQDEASTAQAFAGYESASPVQARDLSFALPRAVAPPLKRKGHVLLDLCTPQGSLERWTVPRSFSKRAFRDARKSSWGDLWALGAKTRVRRQPKWDVKHGGRLSKGQMRELEEEFGSMGVEDGGATDVLAEEGGAQAGEQVLDYDDFGHVVLVEKNKGVEVGSGKAKGTGKGGEVGMPRGEGGRMRTGRKVGGLRDKRDKSGKGNGRRKMRPSEDE